MSANPPEPHSDERDAFITELIEKTLTARQAVVIATHGERDRHGEISCPICRTGTLTYSVAGYNGHIRGQCSTEGCVSWIE